MATKTPEARLTDLLDAGSSNVCLAEAFGILCAELLDQSCCHEPLRLLAKIPHGEERDYAAIELFSLFISRSDPDAARSVLTHFSDPALLAMPAYALAGATGRDDDADRMRTSITKIPSASLQTWAYLKLARRVEMESNRELVRLFAARLADEDVPVDAILHLEIALETLELQDVQAALNSVEQREYVLQMMFMERLSSALVTAQDAATIRGMLDNFIGCTMAILYCLQLTYEVRAAHPSSP